jgi:hypothetical protein
MFRALDEQAQKRFLDARQHYYSARQAWHGLGHLVVDVAKAFEHPRPNYERGWYQISLVGKTRSYPPSSPSVKIGYRFATLDPSKWPTGKQIADAWREVNQAYRDIESAAKNLIQG